MANVYEVAQSFLVLDQQNDSEGISNLKLQKLVYYAQGFYTAIFGKDLFSEQIEAWTHGPVVPELYRQYKEHGKASLPTPENSNLNSLTKDELDLIEEVYNVFGQFSAWQLRNMTHEESPWLNHESDASVIPTKELAEYFKTRLN